MSLQRTPSCSHPGGLPPSLCLSLCPSRSAPPQTPPSSQPLPRPQPCLSPQASGPPGVLVPSLQAQQGPRHEDGSSLLLGRQRVRKLCPITSELCPPPRGLPSTLRAARSGRGNRPGPPHGSGFRTGRLFSLQAEPRPQAPPPSGSPGLPPPPCPARHAAASLNLWAVPPPGPGLCRAVHQVRPPQDSTSSVNKSCLSCKARRHSLLLQRGGRAWAGRSCRPQSPVLTTLWGLHPPGPSAPNPMRVRPGREAPAFPRVKFSPARHCCAARAGPLASLGR